MSKKIKINADGTFRALTKGEIREAALEYFNLLGFDCWRNNNTSPTRRRTFIGRYGVSDVIGYKRRKEGLTLDPAGWFFACEVKTQGDKISEEQKKFLIDVNKAGGYGYIAEDDRKGGVRYYLYLNDKS